MTDTSPQSADRFQRAIMSKTPAERVALACSMFDFAKTLATSSILAQRPRTTAGELRAEVFRRFYASEFTPERLDAIARRIERRGIDNSDS